MSPEELQAGVRTVIQVADYFGELKLRATGLAERIKPQQRGYFTTVEEEECQALLVSYWQARNALFDLVTSFRTDSSLDEESRPKAFLIAFGSALVLVDAARFLRQLVAQRPVVRRKLNEPAPQFNVPGGVYDTIQKSLVSARHGWHLYHAIQYFAAHEAELRSLATDTDLQPVLEVIDELRPRLDVSITQFARTKLRTRGDQVTRHLARSVLGHALYGIQKLAGSLVADKYLRYGHHPLLARDVADRVGLCLRPGDVLVMRKEYALTNYFLPGHWPHAALYLGSPETMAAMGLQEHGNVKPRWTRLLEVSSPLNGAVLESMKDGVHVRALSSPFASDSIVVLRPQLAETDIAHGLARALAHEGKAYDFDFDFSRSDRLVCTEVVYRAYDGIGSVSIPLTSRAGRLTFSGSDLIRMGIRQEHFHPVLAYAPTFSSEVVTGANAQSLLRKAEGLA